MLHQALCFVCLKTSRIKNLKNRSGSVPVPSMPTSEAFLPGAGRDRRGCCGPQGNRLEPLVILDAWKDLSASFVLFIFSLQLMGTVILVADAQHGD